MPVNRKDSTGASTFSLKFAGLLIELSRMDMRKRGTGPRNTLIRAAVTLMRARNRQMRVPIPRMGVRNSEMGARIKRIRAGRPRVGYANAVDAWTHPLDS